MLKVLAADLSRDSEGATPTLVRSVARALFAPRLQAVILLRLAHACRNGPLAPIIKYANTLLTGCDIAPAAVFGPGLALFHPGGVVVGPGVRVGANCTLMQHCTLGARVTGSPTIGDGVEVGPGAVVIGPVRVGDGARIGANAVVTHDIPAGEIWVGIPARKMQTRDRQLT